MRQKDEGTFQSNILTGRIDLPWNKGHNESFLDGRVEWEWVRRLEAVDNKSMRQGRRWLGLEYRTLPEKLDI